MKKLISAIVLAAGKSERMGRPKALLLLRGQTFLEKILEVISRSSIQETILVVGHHREEIERGVTVPKVIFNSEYEKGMITSFQAGIRALSQDAQGALLFLVDHPMVEPETIEALIGHLAPNRIVLPTYEGRRGHPVLFSRDVLEEILALPPSHGANIVVRRDPKRIVEIAVATPGILIDVDTPEQYKALLESKE